MLTELGIGQIGKVIDANCESVNAFESFKVVRKDEFQVGAEDGLSVEFLGLRGIASREVILFD